MTWSNASGRTRPPITFHLFAPDRSGRWSVLPVDEPLRTPGEAQDEARARLHMRPAPPRILIIALPAGAKPPEGLKEAELIRRSEVWY